MAALGGWATLVIKEDGTFRWVGDGHDSGADSYEYGVVGYLRPKPGKDLPPIVAVHHGHVWVHFLGSKHRDDPWDTTSTADHLQANYDDYAEGEFELDIQYSSGILDAIESVFNSALKWAVGSLIDGVGLVIFIGVEVGSLVATGSLAAGARILNNILYMAGPGNTLLAIAAGGIASAGSRSRMLTQVEYDFANKQVFMSAGSTLSTLPPRERLFMTDTKGMNNRAFTFPMADGSITINAGGMAGMYETPVGDPNNPGPFAQYFLHELVHAWQIAHTPMQLSLLASVLASQLRGSTSYNYPAAGPAYKDLNLEQQAQIVQEWWTGQHTHEMPPGSEKAHSTDSPYYRYIVENIQTGTYT
jgi:hypothetical protein